MRPNKTSYTHDALSDRHPADDYPTPAGFIRPLLRFLELDPTTSIWDPCAGAGHLVRCLLDEGFMDVRWDDLHYNKRDFFESEIVNVDWIITNPPYKLAEPFVRRSIFSAREGVAMLMNTAFLESVGRAEGLFHEHPPSQVLMCARRMRLPNGTSSAFSHCWIIWAKGYTDTKLGWVVPVDDLVMPTGPAQGIWTRETL